MSNASETLARLLASEIRGDLLVLFHRNPGLIDTLDGVARRIGRTAPTIEQDVNDLINLGVLKTRVFGKSQALLLDRERDREILETVAAHIKDTREGETL